jgi:hypothetical protein
MSRPTLGEPKPRAVRLPYERMAWMVESEELLPIPEALELPFDRVLDHRRSQRSFTGLERQTLSSLLWASAGTRDASSPIAPWEHRPPPSAGGLHPIHTLLIPHDEHRLARYNGKRHTLEWIACTPRLVEQVRDDAGLFMPAGGATILLFAAEFLLTASCYEQPESLIWRDAGALQGQFGLVAAGLDANFCLLGTTADAWIKCLLGSNPELLGVGAALVGGPQHGSN